jgi:hypothetical protein
MQGSEIRNIYPPAIISDQANIDRNVTIKWPQSSAWKPAVRGKDQLILKNGFRLWMSETL